MVVKQGTLLKDDDVVQCFVRHAARYSNLAFYECVHHTEMADILRTSSEIQTWLQLYMEDIPCALHKNNNYELFSPQQAYL